jgi:hypothetical protein
MKIKIHDDPSNPKNFALVMESEMSDRTGCNFNELCRTAHRLTVSHLRPNEWQIKAWSDYFRQDFPYEVAKGLMESGYPRLDRGLSMSLPKRLE